MIYLRSRDNYNNIYQIILREINFITSVLKSIQLWYLGKEINYFKLEPHLFMVAVRILVFDFLTNKPILFNLKNILNLDFIHIINIREILRNVLLK